MDNIFGIGFLVLFNIAPLFQMVMIMRRGDSYNNGYGMWICGMIGQMCVLGYYIDLGVRGVYNYINSITGLILSVIMIIVIYVYRRK